MDELPQAALEIPAFVTVVTRSVLLAPTVIQPLIMTRSGQDQSSETLRMRSSRILNLTGFYISLLQVEFIDVKII